MLFVEAEKDNRCVKDCMQRNIKLTITAMHAVDHIVALYPGELGYFTIFEATVTSLLTKTSC